MSENVQKTALQIVWFKRDIRLADHSALSKAAEFNEPSLLIYIDEPSLHEHPNYSDRHFQFQYQGIAEIQKRLSPSPFYFIQTEVIEAFSIILEIHDVKRIICHAEISGVEIRDRNIAVAEFCASNQIEFIEINQQIEFSQFQNKQDWNSKYDTYLQNGPVETPIEKLEIQHIRRSGFIDKLPIKLYKSLTYEYYGGEIAAASCLQEFLNKRHSKYLQNISKPLESRSYSSRLSAYLAWGHISTRQIQHEIELKYLGLKKPRSIQTFIDKLKLRDFNIQKFGKAGQIEFRIEHARFSTLWDRENTAYLEAWKNGQTGYPLVDACMRCVMATGYINFKMRAMLVSFLVHHLWQPWQSGAQYLAQMFIDFEPGLHFTVFQMQSMCSGNETNRITNPIKLALELDPNAVFIKHWVPELSHLPATLAREPWKITTMESLFFDFRVGEHYPRPIVEIEQSGEQAQKRLNKTKAEGKGFGIRLEVS